MSARPLSRAEKSLIAKCNEGLTCPEGLEAIDKDSVIECDVCRRIIFYLHFHTVAAAGAKGAAKQGAELDCCNVCRFRYAQLADAKEGGAVTLQLKGVDSKKDSKTFRMAASLRFYCTGLVGCPLITTAGRGRSKAQLSPALMLEMEKQERDPAKVKAEELFTCVHEVNIVKQMKGKRAPSEESSESTESASNEASENEGDTANVEPKAASHKQEPHKKKARAEVRKKGTETILKQETTEPSTAPFPVTPESVLHTMPKAFVEVESTFTGVTLADVVAEITPAQSPLQATATEAVCASDEVASSGCKPVTAAPQSMRESGSVKVKTPKPTDVPSEISSAVPVPRVELMPPMAPPCTPKVDYADAPLAIPSHGSPLRVPPAVSGTTTGAQPIAISSSALVGEQGLTVAEGADDGHDSISITTEKNNTNNIVKNNTNTTDMADHHPAAVDTAATLQQRGDSESEGDLSPEETISSTAEASAAAGAAMEELLGFFDSLPSGFSLPNTDDRTDVTATRFTLHDNDHTDDGNDPAKEDEDSVCIVCRSDEAVSIGSDRTVFGLRAAGITTVDAAWVPLPAEGTAGDAYFSTASVKDQQHTMSLWRVTCGVDPADGEDIIADTTCCYNVLLGKMAPCGIAWVPIPCLYSAVANRVGACSVVRDRSVCTFLLPIDPESEDSNDDDGNDDEPLAATVIMPQIAGLTFVQEPIASAVWSPNVRALDDLRLFVQLKTGAIHVFRHQREEDATIAHTVTNTSDRMRMVMESVVRGPSSSIATTVRLCVGVVNAQLHVVWAAGNEICAARAPFARNGESSVVLRKTVDKAVTALAIVDSGILHATGNGAVKLMRISGKEQLISESIGVAITTIAPTNPHHATSLYLSSRTNQFFHMKRTTMTTMRSLMEFLCTPAPLDAANVSVTTNADLRKGFSVYHIASNHSNANNLMSRVKAIAGGDVIPSEAQWRVWRPLGVKVVEDRVRTHAALALGLCPDGSVVVFLCGV